MTRRLERRLEELEQDHTADLETLFMADLKTAHGNDDAVDPHVREQLTAGALEDRLAESVGCGQ